MKHNRSFFQILALFVLIFVVFAGGRPEMCAPEPGTLRVFNDDATLPSRLLVMGGDFHIFTFFMKASEEEDISVLEMPFGIMLRSERAEEEVAARYSTVGNMQLVDEDLRPVGPMVLSLNQDGQVFIPLDEGVLTIHAGESHKLGLRVRINEYPHAVSGLHFSFLLYPPKVMGEKSGKAAQVEMREPVVSNTMAVFRGTPAVTLNEATPRGTQVPGMNQTVLKLDFAQTTLNEQAVLSIQTLSFEVRGTFDAQGNGSASIYYEEDLNAPLVQRDAKMLVFRDLDGVDRGDEINFEIGDLFSATGLPQNAGVQIFRGNEQIEDMYLVTGVYGGTVFLANADGGQARADLDDGDTLVYRPLQPGGYLVFGGVAELDEYNTLQSGSRGVFISRPQGIRNGFAIGDTLYPRGWSMEGEWVDRVSGCVVTAFDEGKLDFTPCYLTGDRTIYDGYLSSLEAASLDGLLRYDSTTFVVIGDTTGALPGDTLQLVLPEMGMSWTDEVSWTVPIPVPGMPAEEYLFPENLPMEGGMIEY